MKQWWRTLEFLGVGWLLSGAILVGVVGGAWLDGKLTTAPLFTILGLILGLTIGGYGTYQMVMSILNTLDKDKHH